MARARDIAKLVRDGVNDKTSGARLAEIIKVMHRNRISKGLTPEKLVHLLEDLGPTFIKLGQILSARSDMLPHEYCEALATLRSSTTPEPFEHVVRRLENVYGGDYHQVFSHVDEQPLGSASIAQVHKAALADPSLLAEGIAQAVIAEDAEGAEGAGDAEEPEGRAPASCVSDVAAPASQAGASSEASVVGCPQTGASAQASAAEPVEPAEHPVDGACVAVKIRRDHVRQDMLRDIALMRRAVDILNLTGSTTISGVDIATVLDEFDRTVREEIDFTIEMNNLQRFSKGCKSLKGVTCPKIYPELSDETVLVMEFVEGSSLENLDALRAEGYDLRELGDRIANSYMRQMVEQGFFHADPHAANIFVRPTLTDEERAAGKRDPGEVVWIDCGIMGELSPHERSLFFDMMKAMVFKDSYALTNLFIEWGRISDAPGKKLNYGQLLQDLSLLVNRYAAEDVYSMDIAQLLNDIMGILDTANVIMPRSFVTLVRGLAALQGTLIAMTPEISILRVVETYVRSYTARSFDPLKKLEEQATSTMAAAEKTVQIPERVVNVLDMVEKGRLKMGLDLAEANEPMDKLGKIIDKLSLAIITAGLFVGSSTIYAAGMHPQLFGVPVIGFAGFLGAGILSVYILIKIRKGL